MFGGFHSCECSFGEDMEKKSLVSCMHDPEWLDGVFFLQIFYRKVVLENYFNLFFKFKIINN